MRSATPSLLYSRSFWTAGSCWVSIQFDRSTPDYPAPSTLLPRAHYYCTLQFDIALVSYPIHISNCLGLFALHPFNCPVHFQIHYPPCFIPRCFAATLLSPVCLWFTIHGPPYPLPFSSACAPSCEVCTEFARLLQFTSAFYLPGPLTPSWCQDNIHFASASPCCVYNLLRLAVHNHTLAV